MVPFQCFCESVLVPIDLEDLDCFVRGAGCEAAAIVVEDGVVDHVVVARGGDDLRHVGGGGVDNSCGNCLGWVGYIYLEAYLATFLPGQRSRGRYVDLSSGGEAVAASVAEVRQKV